MSGVTLSKKHGVNPSVETCTICGKEMSVVLFGTSYKDENGKTAEAPHKVCLGNIRDDCKKVIEGGGIFFIECVAVRVVTILIGLDVSLQLKNLL